MRSSKQSTNPNERPQDIPPAIGFERGDYWSDAKFRSLIRGAIRQVYFRWPGRKQVTDRVRVVLSADNEHGKKSGVWYACELCGALGKLAYTPKQKGIAKTWKDAVKKATKSALPIPDRPEGLPLLVWVDHIDPVVRVGDPTPTWQDYIMRMFVDPETCMQALCDVCHSAKSQRENNARREI